MRKSLSFIAIILVCILLVACVSSMVNSFEIISSSVPNLSPKETSPLENSSESLDEEDVSFSDLTYVSFGDSITWGKYPQYNGLYMEKSYPVLVGEILGLKQVVNCAVSGSTIAFHEDLTNLTTQLTDAPSEADIVSVMIGVNDYTFMSTLGTIEDSDISTVYGGLNVIVNALKEKYPDAFIFFMTPYPCYNPAWGDITQQEIVQAIKEVCAANSIPCLDMYNYGNFTLVNDPNTDGVHPTQEFTNSYTAPQVAEYIRLNYRGK